MKAQYGVSFHDRYEFKYWEGFRTTHTEPKFSYSFENFFHPFVGDLIGRLNRLSLPAIFDPVWQAGRESDFFEATYAPNNHDAKAMVHVDFFPKQFDVSVHGPYAGYNWELFFHIPLTIAAHLSKGQRFAEAQRWFHYIFDPTSTDKSVEPPKRFWRFLAFRSDDTPANIEHLLTLLSTPRDNLSADDQKLRDDIVQGYHATFVKPFQPHVVARTRPVAYQYSVVMKYLDNLIAWGDYLFQQDTVESINEATQRYVLAANILGPRPQRIPPRGKVKPRSFHDLKQEGILDEIGNALVELEGQFPFNAAAPSSGQGASNESAPLFGIGRTLYFCVPRNDKLLAYWDTVADRLFKIRNCMNIAGVVRQLALFDPPIDPGLLVKAAAAGIDIGSAVNGLTQPAGPVRSVLLIQKALEICAEVRSLGSALLAALEKGDGEHLAAVRQRHDIQIQQLTQEVRYLQWKGAEEATKSLLTSRGTALERLRYYQRLLGLPADQNLPDTITIDRRPLTEENFDEAFNALVGQYDKAATLQSLPALKLAGDTSPAQQSGASGAGRLYLSANENAELNVHLPIARDTRLIASAIDVIASVLTMIPEITVNLEYWGLGASPTVFGGSKLGAATKIGADIVRTISAYEQDQAGMAARTAGHERRADEWILQYNLAAHELMQIGRQILTSLIGEQSARHEYDNVRKQIDNAQEVGRLLEEKFTNEDLYFWMQGEVSRLYYEYYRFAFDTARKAERTMKQELMRPEVDAQDFVKFNYWDGGRKGLLAGEALHLDVKRMEMAYHDNNKREIELTRHVSLRQLDPLALITLRATGTCQVTIPEWLFDRDCPGHYMRRIKTIALSIPSVVGPYTSVNCTVSLLRSTIRKSPVGDDYSRQGPEDSRFADFLGTVQSIVTSSAVNDPGLFEANLHDERFLPFEGAGAESTWKLELPKDYRAFDYGTISDVIFHMRYTARQGVPVARVKQSLDALFQDAANPNLALLFALRQDFPNEWAAFVNSGADFAMTLRKEHFPYLAQGRTITVTEIDLFVVSGNGTTKRTIKPVAAQVSDDLNGENRRADLSIAKDNTVLKAEAARTVFILIRYALNA